MPRWNARPKQREAYLAAECGGDEELRREVESLINDGDSRARFSSGPQ